MGLNWIERIMHPDARMEKRQVPAGVVAHYWDGGNPQRSDVLNISLSGICLRTNDHWYPDTVLKLMLQSNPEGKAGRSNTGAVALCILARVVQASRDRVGLEFLFAGKKNDLRMKTYPECATDRCALREFLASIGECRKDLNSKSD